MKALQRSGRVTAVISMLAAVGAGSMIAAGTAYAQSIPPSPTPPQAEQAEPAECVENVNVREQPSLESRIVALCRAGTTVQAGEIQNGFVRLNDLGGWSAQEFISIDGAPPVQPGDPDAEDTDAERPNSFTDGSADGEPELEDEPEPGAEPAPGAENEPQPPRSGPGGLPLPLPPG